MLVEVGTGRKPSLSANVVEGSLLCEQIGVSPFQKFTLATPLLTFVWNWDAKRALHIDSCCSEILKDLHFEDSSN